MPAAVRPPLVAPVGAAANEPPDWLVRNYGPRCTLVSSVSALQALGARGPALVSIIESFVSFNDRSGPRVAAYLGGHSALDRGIEHAAVAGGIAVRSRTRFLVHFADIRHFLDRGWPVVLNCYRAPSGQWSHSVLATSCRLEPRRLLTLDPNDGAYRWLIWLRPSTGWVCTATFIEPMGSTPGSQG